MSAQTIEQAIRRSHCSHEDREKADHRCAGTCTISPRGLTLECKLCGDDFEERHPYDRRCEERAKAVLGAAGLDFNDLSDKARARVVRVLRQTMCPGCGVESPAHVGKYDSHICACDKWWFYDGRWSKRKEAP